MINPEDPPMTPDGLISDLYIIDKRGIEVPYVSPSERARINSERREGDPKVADVQPYT